IGISSCLLGERVRHDGGPKRNDWLVDVIGRDVEWVPVCPEVEAGFGTPREPMDLVRTPRGSIALMTKHTRRDVTTPLRDFSAKRVDELEKEFLSGYVLKADSPSCGLQETPSRGLFADALVSRFPDLPVEDERQLGDPARRRQFVERVFAYYQRRSHPAGSKKTAAHSNQMTDALRSFDIIRVRGDVRSAATDRAAAEEPLEIRLHRRPFAVIMRTPGADRELAAGFLLSERVIRSADDLGAIEHCADGRDGQDGRERPEGGHPAENIVNVTLADAAQLDRIFESRRQVTTNSSCGLCGRLTIESLATDVPPIASTVTMTAATLATLPARLRGAQAVFDETGGLHAAGLFKIDGADGQLVDTAEDVGRHNALDKVVGRMLMRDALPLSQHVLCVSGRTSYEIVQKAIVAGIPIVAAVSAPSSLAIDLARTCGVTLVGFVRGDTFNIYSHPQRIL
ncbi:MAG TPA: formate dehydrogenase accessory sulfurtransferase FdhD, partial [Vicinamibacterales bacterium]|nr:formate dehydrogenase accessory sulfurtransferase FdhD [Vicinamibacterales bacterium]